MNIEKLNIDGKYDNIIFITSTEENDMKVIIAQTVMFENDNFPYTWRKTVETDVIPHKGDSIEDSLWKDPGEYEVVETIINYQERFCYVTVQNYKYVVPQSRKEEFKKIAESHGWEALWNNL